MRDKLTTSSSVTMAASTAIMDASPASVTHSILRARLGAASTRDSPIPGIAASGLAAICRAQSTMPAAYAANMTDHIQAWVCNRSSRSTTNG